MGESFFGFNRKHEPLLISFWGELEDLFSQVERSRVVGDWLLYEGDSTRAGFVSRTRDYEGYPTFSLSWNKTSAQILFKGSAAKYLLKKFKFSELDPMSNLGRFDYPDRILDRLYLGSQEASLNRTALQTRGITHILSIGKELSQPYTEEINYKLVEAWDDPKQDLYKYFDECIEFINEGREAGGVLIHCQAGISRSSTVCLAYVMKEEGLSLEEAFTFVNSRHFISPNAGFWKQLMLWEKVLTEMAIIESNPLEDEYNIYYSFE